MTTKTKSVAPQPTVRTLILKEQLLCQELQVTEELILALQEIGLAINPGVLKKQRNKDRVKLLLIDLKTECLSRDNFMELCGVLENCNPWLGDELRQEFLGEVEETEISEALDVENGRIVFKEFGNEKRLAEQEKKKLLKILNRKTQCTRNIWEQQLERLNKKIEEARAKNGTIEEEAAKLAKDIAEFIDLHADQFKNRGVIPTATSTSELFQSIPPLKLLERKTKCLIQLAGQSLMEAELIQNEKDRVAERINVKSNKGDIDLKLKGVLEDKRNRILLCRQSIKEQEQLAAHLELEIQAAEERRIKEVAEKQAVIDRFNEKIAIKDKENDDLTNYVMQLRMEMAKNQQHLNKCESRVGDLEKNKRLVKTIGPLTKGRRATLIDHSIQLPPKFQVNKRHATPLEEENE